METGASVFVSPRATPSAGAGASRLSTLPLLGRNVATAAGDYGRRLAQDNGSLKTNIAVIGILIQVIARIIVAYRSAQKAKGTPEEAYRRMEFIRTTMRESLGWSLGFGGFRMFDLAIKRGVRKFLEMPDAPTRHSRLVFSRMGHDIKSWLAGRLERRQPESGLISFASQSFESHVSPDQLQKKLFGTTALRLINFFSRQTPGVAFTNKVQTFYKWFPSTVGLALSISLAGFWLERFSIEHSREAARIIDRVLNGGKTPPAMPAGPPKNARAQSVAPATEPQALSGLSPAPSLAHPRGFMDYMARVQQQRAFTA